MAEPLSGYSVAIGLEEETTYGTDPGSTREWFEYISESITRSFETLEEENTRGRVIENNASQGQVTVEGSFDVHVNSENIGHLLYGILGTSSSPTDNGDGSYEHTISTDETDLPSWTVETEYDGVNSDSDAKIVTGARFNGLDVDLADGLVTCSTSLVGQDMDAQASPTSVTFTDWPRTFSFRDFAMEVGDNGDSFGDSNTADTSVQIDSGTISLASNNVEDDYRQGNQNIQGLPPGTLSVTMDLTVVYDPNVDSAVLNFFDGQATDKKVFIQYTGDNIAGSNDHEVLFRMEHAYAESGTPEVSGPGERIERSVTIQGLYDFSDSSGFDVKIVNTKSTSY